MQVLEARPLECVLRKLGDADGVQQVVMHEVEAMQVTKVNKVRRFKYNRGRS